VAILDKISSVFGEGVVVLKFHFRVQNRILGSHILIGINPVQIPTLFTKKIQQVTTMYQNFIIPYLYEAQHVSGDTPPIIRSLKLHWQPLVFHRWKVVGHVAGRLCQTHCA
jgi:hypothetical protein